MWPPTPLEASPAARDRRTFVRAAVPRLLAWPIVFGVLAGLAVPCADTSGQPPVHSDGAARHVRWVGEAVTLRLV